MGQNVSAYEKSDFSPKNISNAAFKKVVSGVGWGTPMPTYMPNFGPFPLVLGHFLAKIKFWKIEKNHKFQKNFKSTKSVPLILFVPHVV